MRFSERRAFRETHHQSSINHQSSFDADKNVISIFIRKPSETRVYVTYCARVFPRWTSSTPRDGRVSSCININSASGKQTNKHFFCSFENHASCIHDVARHTSSNTRNRRESTAGTAENAGRSIESIRFRRRDVAVRGVSRTVSREVRGVIGVWTRVSHSMHWEMVRRQVRRRWEWSCVDVGTGSAK